jgi:hypothetical protein
MKPTSKSSRKPKLGFIRIRRQHLKGLPKTASAIDRWIRRLGGRPVDAATKSRLQDAGHWGMPEE